MVEELRESKAEELRAKSIMIQGTMSNAGKSFLTAGLCRVFKQDGYKTAPFKSQNMALNSYITEEGLEIGRAQAMQAEAAGIKPSVLMNPILLKPTGYMGSQVIVNGEIYGNMKAADYYKKKKQFIPVVQKSYEKLAENYDIIVIEGAGSPAEINLKKDDFVNMGMAKIAKAPVLLAGDIDRGGVFAALYGTVKLLEEEEQAYIKGTIINKFRGDLEILKPGLRMIEEKTELPVLGVVPMEKIDIDDEDSLSERLLNRAKGFGVSIAVVKLPHISNFTDFNIFERMEKVSLSYAAGISELEAPDLIILPGTKNTMADLRWLRESGLEALILKYSAQGVPVIGICGGYQMLGMELEDPFGVEEGGSMRGIGLLPVKTVFEGKKTRTRINGKLLCRPELLQGVKKQIVSGYEIHMGKTTLLGKGRTMLQFEDGRMDAAVSENGKIFGTYLHGFFDSAGIADAMIKQLLRKKGLDDSLPEFDLEQYKEREYDKLADLIRKSIDMDKIYKILENGIS